MKKKLEICGKEYDVSTNALTPFLYKKEFKTGMITDIGRLQDLYFKQQKGEDVMPELDNFIEVVFRMAYILIKTSNKDFMSFEPWLETISDFSFEDKWISEVTELAVNSFLGQGATGTNESPKN